ncbi:uncharacterized protein LOC110647935 isoform X2 [Hevea brasiliensis]|uniref:uncharacterized protein LOC110647935 isoform X2 n=1 Tax=Hevea brasiliensis TaxID=3981 RepID=UPI0025E0AF3B|nr:uncharacterized protein LOC110647935 isoform X2 [Hevea brasiliensis]
MAKKRTTDRQKTRKKKLHLIDNIPNYTKQPRSPAPKRRSDFSSFFSSPSSFISNSGPLRHGLFSITISSSDKTTVQEKELPELPIVRCRNSADKKSKLLSDLYENAVIKIKSVAQHTIVDHCSDSYQTSFMTMESTPEKSQVTESTSFCVTPGNVVWAKMDCQIWWPAEIIGETSSEADSRSKGIDGHVLVQFYGNYRSAWVDPAREISQLEDCFEERSSNTMDTFQDALKQALKRKEYLSVHRQLLGIPDGSDHPYQQDQSSDKWTSSISSRTECNFLKRRKGKKKQKPKICFDEVVFPLRSARKVRRFRIMRYLGLVAPIGSFCC